MDSTDPKSPEVAPSLALVRTDLANERTLLAYGRTALMVGATGVSLLKLFGQAPLPLIAGWCFVITSLLIAGIGVTRFHRLRKRLRS
jgi:putative membrane protein